MDVQQAWPEVAHALVRSLRKARGSSHVIVSALELLFAEWARRWQTEPPTEHEAALLWAVAETYANDLLRSFPTDLHPPYPAGLSGRELQLYEAGFLAGFALGEESARAEIQRVHDEADRLYLLAFPDERLNREEAFEDALAVMPGSPEHITKGTP